MEIRGGEKAEGVAQRIIISNLVNYEERTDIVDLKLNVDINQEQKFYINLDLLLYNKIRGVLAGLTYFSETMRMEYIFYS